jgi:hypothetical protein
MEQCLNPQIHSPGVSNIVLRGKTMFDGKKQ